MTLSKSTLTVASIAMAFIFGGGAYLYTNLSLIAKRITQNVATQALGVPVTIDTMIVSIPEKSVMVKGLKVANPKGFKAPYAMRADEIRIDAESFSKELLIFKDIKIIGVHTDLEVQTSGTNFGAIKDNLAKKKTESAAAPSKAAGQAVKVIIRDLEIGAATLQPRVLLLGDTMDPITIPALRLRGIGQKTNGILAKDAIAQVWSKFSSVLSDKALGAGYLKGLSADNLKREGVKRIQNVIEENVPDAVRALEGGVRGLFGN